MIKFLLCNASLFVELALIIKTSVPDHRRLISSTSRDDTSVVSCEFDLCNVAAVACVLVALCHGDGAWELKEFYFSEVVSRN